MVTAGLPPGAELRPSEIANRSGSNFLIGFVGLGPARRAGMTAIYAFCRVADDAVDEAADPAQGERQLGFWRRELAAVEGGRPQTEVGRALQQTVRVFGTEPRYLRALLDGVAMDLLPPSFEDLASLENYCWHVASAVGLACLPVLGATGVVAETFADRLGKALQLTNILRDIASDARNGRVYLPRAWLREAGIDPAWLRGDGPGMVYGPEGPLASVARRLAAAARANFAAAGAALRSLPWRQRRRLLPARIMGAVYADLLRRLEQRGGDLRGPRVRVPKARKLLLLLQVTIGARA